MKRFVFIAALMVLVSLVSVSPSPACSPNNGCTNAAYQACAIGMQYQWRSEKAQCYAVRLSCEAACDHDSTLSPGERIQCKGFCTDDEVDCDQEADGNLCWNLDECEVEYCYVQGVNSSLATTPQSHAISARDQSKSLRLRIFLHGLGAKTEH